jgi:SLOG cluster2
VLLSAKSKQPVFLVGAFGGVPAMILDIIDGKFREEMTWDYQKTAPHSEDMRTLYGDRGEDWWDYPAMSKYLQDLGLEGLNPLLSDQEHRELATTRNPNIMIELIMKGLGGL